MKTQLSTAASYPHWPAIACITLAAGVVYANSLLNGFVFDDHTTIVNNPHLAQFKKFGATVFSNDYFKIAVGENSYRPLTTLSYYLLYAAFGLSPWGYHLVSLLLHLSCSLLVYTLGWGLYARKKPALLAALVFAVHPVLSEAVNCISYNEDLLAGLFFLLALWLYLRFGKWGYWGSLVFYLAGLLSKEMAITLPAVIVLWDLARFRQPFRVLKQRLWLYAGYLAVGLLYLLLRFVIFDNPHKIPSPLHGSLWERLFFLPLHLLQFIRLAIYPHPLSAKYAFSYPSSLTAPLNILAWGILGGVIAVGIYLFLRRRVPVVGLGWFFITLLPVSNLVPIHNPLADRYLYLPMVGFCLLMGWVLGIGLERWPRIDPPLASWVRGALILLLLCLLGGATIQRNRIWRDDASLWTATIRMAPNSAVAHGSLGKVYYDQGRINEAIAQYRKAIELNPSEFRAYYNLGVAHEHQNRLDEAARAYKQSIQNNPRFADAYFNLANLQVRQEALSAAASTYEQMLAIYPEDIQARNNLGVVYARLERLEEAASQWQIVLELDPQNSNASKNLNQARQILEQSP